MAFVKSHQKHKRGGHGEGKIFLLIHNRDRDVVTVLRHGTILQ